MLNQSATATDPSHPTFRSFAGAFLGTSDHNFLVESEVVLPLCLEAPLGLYYRYRETTPFLGLDRGGLQANVLYYRHEFQADLTLTDPVRLTFVGGHRASYTIDRTGKTDAAVFGAGLGSPRASGEELVSWSITAGGFADRESLQSDWWADLHAAWRAWDLGEHQHLDSNYRTALVLGADIETTNDGGRIRGNYQVGPEFQFLTAAGNRANLHARWYVNDGNEFYRNDDRGLLLGFEMTASLEEDAAYHALEERRDGVFPVVWGAYDIGIGDTRRISRFEMNIEAFDVKLADRRYTCFIWYESRQEHRVGEYDNINYSVSVGAQTPLGLASVLSQGHPLVFGCDFLHRSDHALNPGEERVTDDGQYVDDDIVQRRIPGGSYNLLPRLRLQTVGWDLPYRDPTMYDNKTGWLHFIDWRLTVGYSVASNRDRSALAGQVGLNWDAATIRGFVAYGRAVYSMGDETPDWAFEAGVRRPLFRLFTRYERYGTPDRIARGDTLIAGMGFNL